MNNIVKTIKEAVCLPDTECVSVTQCLCDILQDAADEIERLREENREMRLWLSSLEIADPDGRVWKRAEIIHKELTEKEESEDA